MPARSRPAPHDLDGKRGEEVPQVVHVAVNALDHFARRVLVMERHVQPQAVPGQVRAQGVGRGPGDALAEVGGEHRNNLLTQCHPTEQQRQRHERSKPLARLSGVNEAAENLRCDQQQVRCCRG